MKLLVCLVLFIFLPYSSFSQHIVPEGTCKIKGRIIDSTQKKPIGYATITASSPGSNNIAGGTISDDKGKFVIDNLPPGDYLLKIDFIGYNTKTIPHAAANEKHVTDIGEIALAATYKAMNEVTVKGSRNFMENHLDKFVYNVEKDLTSQGGVATDILKKVPQISVDVDGNVELLGSSNIRVFINGKPSTMFDNNLAEALQAIPASQIKSIEVITSPGAQYDAQGTGGIINIILKDNKSQGINGSVALSGGTRLENGSANIHARKGHLDVSASLSGNAQLKGTTLNTLDRHTNDSSQIIQNGTGALQKNGYRGQLGMDWAISKKDDINASVSYNNFGTITNGITNQQQFSYFPDTAETNSIRNSYNSFRYKTLDWNINYTKKFSTEGQEMDISYQASNGRGNTYYDQTESYMPDSPSFSGGRGTNKLSDNETYLIADYAQPLSKNTILNVGVKGTFSRINSYSDDYNLDPAYGIFTFNQLNNFNYSRDVYAAYTSITFPLFDVYTFKLGIRDEYTTSQISGDTTTLVPSYNSFIPSVIISRKLKNNQTIKISYYRRLQRASYKDLNPFIDATDPTNLVQGNPYLKPQRTNAGELSYFKSFNNGSSILAMLYYRNTQDDEQSYVLHASSLQVGNTLYNDVIINTNENAGTQQITGLNISGTLALSEKLEVRGSAILFNKYIVSNLIPGNTSSSFNYRINGNANYKFSKTLIAECFYSFNSPRTEIQGKFPSFTSYSFAVRQLIFKQKASIAFTTTDPFNKYTNQPTNIVGADFTEVSDRKIPYRSFGLSFTYKFGKMEYKEKKQEHNEGNNGEEGN